jgi:uncharacterized protein (TIGR03000 family)
MVRRQFSIAGLLAVGVMMIAADASQAQLLQRLRDRMGRGSSDEGSSRRFSLRRSYYRGEQTVTENGVPITNGTPVSSSPISSSQVALEIRVPSSAEVFVAGEKISGTGTMRTFTSDNLTSGQTYEYKVKGKWTENGKEVVHERTVKAVPGKRTMVDLTRSAETRPGTSRPKGEQLKAPKESDE